MTIHTFNRTACIYQIACYSMRFLPPYRITIWLIDNVTLVVICLRDDLDLVFCYSNLRRETDGLELALTIILMLQANRLNKYASQQY